MDTAKLVAVLEARRKEQGISLRELAERTGTPFPTLARYMRGEREFPVVSFFQVIEALGIDGGTLIRGDGEVD